jgi:hypothetical protein
MEKKADIKGKDMLELGNQRIRPNAFLKYGIRSYFSKIYFLKKGYNHHAIDINGYDGAIPLDMSEPIPITAFRGHFDIVTDFGFMEHVNEQVQAWRNIHDMGKVGCLYVHSVPAVGMYKGHCYYCYSEDFFKDLCKANNYELLDLKTINPKGDHAEKDEVVCAYIKKTENKFNPHFSEPDKNEQ